MIAHNFSAEQNGYNPFYINMYTAFWKFQNTRI